MASPNVREQPADYGDPVAEYAALTQGAALTDRSSVGRLRMGGSDALDLLNRLSTNKLEELLYGHGLPTVITSPKGRVVDLLLVGARSDHLLLLTSPGQAQAIAEWVDFYTFGEDVSMEDAGPETVLYALAGPDAEKVLSEAGAPAQHLPRYGLRDAVMGGAPVVLWNTLSAGAPTFEVVAERAHASAVWEALVGAGALPAGETAWEALRVARGVPAYGAEFGEATNPLESRLRGAVSFDKGCYTGQEVVARLDTYRKVQRSLMALSLSGPAAVGDLLVAADKRVGALTSVAQVPAGPVVGLALVDAAYAVPDRELAVGSGGVTASLADPAYAVATEPVTA